MKIIITAQDKRHLMMLIKNELKKYGYKADLNHIDVSQVTDMSSLFFTKRFNGNISRWNTTNVKNMKHMFSSCSFNGDISGWNVSNVEDMSGMFFNSKFKKDISHWQPLSLRLCQNMFDSYYPHFPYWFNYSDEKERSHAINSYITNNRYNALDKELTQNTYHPSKRIKI